MASPAFAITLRALADYAAADAAHFVSEAANERAAQARDLDRLFLGVGAEGEGR